MSDNTTQDRRIARTQTMLWQALFDLLLEKPWNEINVSQICRGANVARSSFYLHFQNKRDLLDYGFGYGLKNAKTEISNYEKNHQGLVTLHWLAHHIYSVHGLKRSGFVDDEYIFSRFQQVVEELVADELRSRDTPLAEDVMSFLVGGIFAVLRDWVEDGAQVPPDTMASRLNSMASMLVQPTAAVTNSSR